MICTSLAVKSIARLTEVVQELELAEIRIDLCKLKKKEIVRIFSSRPNLIATCRPGLIRESERILFLKEAIFSGAGYVDIEIDSPASSKEEILRSAVSRGCRVIMSYHNESGTPPISRLKRIVRQGFGEGADICKIACRCSSIKDMATIFSLYGEFEDFKGRIISLGIGKKASLTRIAAPFLGAPFTYASLEDSEKTAEGQISFQEMETLLSQIKKAVP